MFKRVLIANRGEIALRISRALRNLGCEVAIIHGREDRLSFLEPLGKITLTVYVAHFAVLGIIASMMQGEPRLELVPAFAATIGHTLIWIPLAILHQRYYPKVSLEELLRVFTSRA